MCEISIITPVYNKSKYLARTVNSILKQSFVNYELLLIDDGSTDESGLICDQFAIKDNRIKVFHTENHGVSSARNLGIKNANGKYVCFVDADDYVKKEFLEKLYDSIQKNKTDIAVCDYYEIKNGSRKNYEYRQSEIISDIYTAVNSNLLCIVWNKLFVREKIKHLFDEKLSTCEDSIFCVRFYLDNNATISYVDDMLYGYIRHNGGLTATFQPDSLLGINKYYTYYIMLAKQITEKGKRQLAIYNICRIYLFCICTFIFENINQGSVKKEKAVIIGKIINCHRYRNAVRYLIKHSIFNEKAGKLAPKEMIYAILSFFKMKNSLYIFARIKRVLKPYE